MKKIFIILLLGIAGFAFAPNNQVQAQSTCDVTLTVQCDFWYWEAYYIVYDPSFNVVLGWQTFSNYYQTKTHTLPALADGAQYLVITYDTWGDGGIAGTVSSASGVPLTSWTRWSYSTYGYNYFTNVCAAAGPANDDCSGAEPISCGQSISGSTSAASPDYMSFCGTSNTAPGVWYTFPGDGSCVTLSTCNSGTSYDTKITVYEGSCGTLTCVAGNDDDFSCGNSIFNSTVNFSTNVGSEYFVLVHGWSSNTGDFELSMECAPPPGNDDVCDAYYLSVGTFNNPIFYWADNNCASAQPGEVSPGPGTTQFFTCNSQDGWCSFETGVQTSVWYTFRAPASGCANIAAGGFLNSSPVDWQLAVWDVGDCGDFSTFTEVAANDDTGPGFSPYIVEMACLTPGKTYYIQLDGYNGTQGLDAITVWDCGNAILTADAGACQTNFDGWDGVDQYNYLTGSASGGFPGYSYSWSPTSSIVSGANSQTATVDPSVPTTYTLTVTDSKGCTATSTVFVDVVNVDCSNNGNAKKVEVCHVPPGNPANAHVICISENAVGTHLDEHTDNLGYCGNPCLTTNDPPPPCTDVNISITTDFFGSETSWELVNVTTGSTIESVGNTLSSSTTYTYSYCLDLSQCYEFRIYDSYGDGICCFWGSGSYTVNWGNGSASGGSFGSSDVVSFGNCTSNKLASDEDVVEEMMDVSTRIKAFPSPTSDLSKVEFVSGVNGDTKLELVDITGKQVAVIYEGDVEANVNYNFEQDVSMLKEGVYFYRLFNAEGVKTFKQVILRQ